MDLVTIHINHYVVILIHLLTSYAVACWFYDKITGETGQAKLWKWIVTVFSFFIPIAGPLGLVIIYRLLAHKMKYTSDPFKINFEDHLQHIIIPTDVNDQKVDYNWKDFKEIQPIIEIFRGTDLELKKGAIDSLTVKGDMNSIRLLKDALDYSDPEIRYFIAEALTKISKQYSDQIFVAKSALEQDPGSEEKLLKLADCYYDFANCMIEDHTLNQYYYELAAFYFSEILKHRELTRLEKNRYSNALRHIGKQKEALDMVNTLAPAQKMNWDELSNLLELHFLSANYGKLSEIARLIRDSETSTNKEIEKSMSLWV